MFGESIRALSYAARTPEFTRDELNVWHAILGRFPNWILNRAVVEIAVAGENRFPGVNDLYRVCRREALRLGVFKQQYNPHGTPPEVQQPRLSPDEVDSIGQSMGLQVTRPEKTTV